MSARMFWVLVVVLVIAVILGIITVHDATIR